MEYRKALLEVARNLGIPRPLCSYEIFMKRLQTIVESLTSSAPNGTDLNAISQTIKQGGELDDKAVNKIVEVICSNYSKNMSDEEAREWTKLQEEEIAPNSQKSINTMLVKDNGTIIFQTITVYGASSSEPAYSCISKIKYGKYASDTGFFKSDILYCSKGIPISGEKSRHDSESEIYQTKKILYYGNGTKKGSYTIDNDHKILKAKKYHQNGNKKCVYKFIYHGKKNHAFSFKGDMYDEEGVYTGFQKGQVVGGKFLSKTTGTVNEKGEMEEKTRLFDIKCSLALSEIARRCGIPEYLYINDIFMKKFKSIVERICSLDDERNCLNNIAKKIKEDGKLNDKEICSICDRIKEYHLAPNYLTSIWSSEEHKPDERIVILQKYYEYEVIFQSFTTSKNHLEKVVGCRLDEEYSKDKNGQLHTNLSFYEEDSFSPVYRILTTYNSNNSIAQKDEKSYEDRFLRKKSFYYDEKGRISSKIVYHPYKRQNEFKVASEYNYDYSNNDGDGTYTFSGREYDEDGVNTKYHIGNVVDGVKRYEQISHLDEKGEVAFYEKKEYNEDGTPAKRPESQR